jgi:hypothetical protein
MTITYIYNPDAAASGKKSRLIDVDIQGLESALLAYGIKQIIRGIVKTAEFNAEVEI